MARGRIWRQAVAELLGQGLGVEDIALRLKANQSEIREEITKLREGGKLRAVLGLNEKNGAEE